MWTVSQYVKSDTIYIYICTYVHIICGPSPRVISTIRQSLVHISMSLDMAYIQGATALINSILKNASCPQHLFFHFMVTGSPSSNGTTTTMKANSDTDTYEDISRDDDSTSVIDDPGYPDAERIINFYFPFIEYRMYHIDEDTLRTTV